ncbi:MAG: ATP-binding protein [Ignavibacteria bacterium]|nr:ATP-binding protein [Ignavibacteria bacterium]
MANQLKKKTNRNNFESSFREGEDTYFDKEANLVQFINHPKMNSVFPLHQRKLKLFEYEFLKTYLYALHTESLNNPDLNIDNFNAMSSSANPAIVAPDIIGADSNGLAIVENHSIFVNLKFKKSAYQVTVYVIMRQDSDFNIPIYYISVLGTESDSFKTIALADYLIKESIRNSYYKNKILNVTCDDDDRLDINQTSIDKFSDEDLKDLFIPDNVKSELERFYLCVENFSNIGFGLRYLLCGEPGTGKTKSVRALIKQCYGKATIIISEGKIDFKSIFEFAKLFSPVIICIDDLDLLIGNRDNTFYSNGLSNLLQELDGFEKNSVFLLTTTNDKNLIDKAASRPGRFDMVIDYNKLNKDNYLDLINANCKTPQIVDALDDTIIKSLQKYNIKGAYLVNLIKQMEIKHKLEPEYDLKNYVKNLIKLTYRGFYKKSEENDFQFGFSNNGNGFHEL